MGARRAVVLLLVIVIGIPATSWAQSVYVTTVSDIYYDSERNMMEAYGTATVDYASQCYYQVILNTHIKYGDVLGNCSGDSYSLYAHYEQLAQPGVTYSSRTYTYVNILYYNPIYYYYYDVMGYSLIENTPPYTIKVYVWAPQIIYQAVQVARRFLGSTQSEEETAPGQLCAIPCALTKYSFYKEGLQSVIYYVWGSSSGKWQDLASCQAQEIINFTGTPSYPPPRPPNGPWQGWDTNKPNPYTQNFGAIGQTLTDNYYPGTLSQPYVASSIVGSQEYQYRCVCHDGGNWTDIEGPNDFKMEVKQNPGWQYKFSKYLYSNTAPLP